MEIVNLGAETTTYRLEATFAVNATFSTPYENVVRYITQEPDATAALQARVNAWENDQKSQWPEWIERDAGRNGSFAITAGPRPDPIDPEGVEYYDLSITWGVLATARIEVTGTTDAAPFTAEFQAWSEGLCNAAVAEWLQGRRLTPNA